MASLEKTRADVGQTAGMLLASLRKLDKPLLKPKAWMKLLSGLKKLQEAHGRKV